MVEVIILDDVKPAELMLRVCDEDYGETDFTISATEARTLYDQLGACLGALDAETHPKNPERK